MIYFTADLHFHHDKIIRHTGRPFHNADEMDRALIRNWNGRIGHDDDVYILGDFTMKGAEVACACLSSLPGRKHLIRGNHDNFLDSPGFEPSLFASIQDYAEMTYANVRFVLFHYPILEWNGYRKGAIMLHGHQHNHKDYNSKNRRDGILRYDVGVDANDMAPVSAEEIIRFFS
ncbi:MAG: hydrolase [Lachnospiraceae bacterium]|uniref:metallophosphoesterase n=1 Tax=uncultured Acetatifactor sp. TaxID=1671927 RepID=UPI002624ADCB|nr:metallophosphoesterase [uncultured Acetatifactor sp.]MCI8790765.1 hydrolase [Lachnospiraceae bacterium]